MRFSPRYHLQFVLIWLTTLAATSAQDGTIPPDAISEAATTLATSSKRNDLATRHAVGLVEAANGKECGMIFIPSKRMMAIDDDDAAPTFVGCLFHSSSWGIKGAKGNVVPFVDVKSPSNEKIDGYIVRLVQLDRPTFIIQGKGPVAALLEGNVSEKKKMSLHREGGDEPAIVGLTLPTGLCVSFEMETDKQ